MKINIFKNTFKNIIIAIKKYYIALIVIIIFILSLICINIYINLNYINKYKVYKEKMEMYGFDILYNNGKINSLKNVKNSEAIKIIICAMYNKDKLENFTIQPKEDTYKNEAYVDFANNIEILSNEINNKNYNKNISKISVLNYLTKAKKYILNKELDLKDNVDVKDIKKYSQDEVIAIKDATYNQIISNNKNINGNKKIKQGEFNKFIVDYVEKYNVISNGEKVNINPEKLPANYKDYPYTLAQIDKKVYEYPNKLNDINNSTCAKDEYSYKKEYYNQIKEFGQEYMNTILNIDYTKIDKENFKNTVNKYLGNKLDDDVLNKYIDYVKSNKIIIKGKAVAQMPCIYYDGIFYRLRININYDIVSADKKENLLLFDFNVDNVIYTKTTNNMYIDLPYTVSPFINIIYVDDQNIKDSIISNDNL